MLPAVDLGDLVIHRRAGGWSRRKWRGCGRTLGRRRLDGRLSGRLGGRWGWRLGRRRNGRRRDLCRDGDILRRHVQAYVGCGHPATFSALRGHCQPVTRLCSRGHGQGIALAQRADSRVDRARSAAQRQGVSRDHGIRTGGRRGGWRESRREGWTGSGRGCGRHGSGRHGGRSRLGSRRRRRWRQRRCRGGAIERLHDARKLLADRFPAARERRDNQEPCGDCRENNSGGSSRVLHWTSACCSLRLGLTVC
jgi:hypothetical protein